MASRSAPLSASALAAIEARHPEVFSRRPWKRYGAVLAAVSVVAYCVFCWWFFSFEREFRKADWHLAGSYLADWISWEARPDFRMSDDLKSMQLIFPRFSKLGPDPHPDWIAQTHERVTHEVKVEGESAAPALQRKIANSFMVPDAQGTLPEAGAGAPAPAQPGSSFGFMTPGSKGFTAADAGGAGAAAPSPARRTVTEEVLTHAVITIGRASVDVTPTRTIIRRGHETLTVVVEPGKKVGVVGPLPEWAEQKYAGEKVIAWLGFAGRVEIDYDSVKARRRFLGWANFVFDTNSPFWGKSAGEVWSLISSPERIDPKMSNLALAWDNVLNNEAWQHGDVWLKLIQTIVMAFVGTLFASAVAFPLSFLAARNITKNRFLNHLNKRFFDFQRSVDMLIWALFFTRAFGPGPLSGISAIFFTDTGTLGKLYSEALENVDDKQREGIRSVGAAPVLVQRYGVLPQVLPVFTSQALYFWESNIRSATIIGAVGAGGIGLKLWESMRTNQNWSNVAYMVLLILMVVFIFDNISNALRSRLIGRAAR